MVEIDSSNFGIFFDVINYSIVLFIIFLCFKLNKIDKLNAICLTIFCLTPFLGNDVFFDFFSFPDQSKYINNVVYFRSNFFEIVYNFFTMQFQKISDLFAVLNHEQFPKMKRTAFFISIIPLPFIDTVQSLAFFSKFLSCLVSK